MQRFLNDSIYLYIKKIRQVFNFDTFYVMRVYISLNTVLLVLTFVMISCDANEKNNIDLSTKYLEMSSQAGSSVIYVDGKDWWINDVNVEGIRLYATPEDIEKDCESIEGDWFVIEKDGDDKLHVSVLENGSGHVRKMVMTIESENYFDYISVYQRGKE